MGDWLHFAIVVAFQLIAFLFLVVYRKESDLHMLHTIGKAMLIGIPFGIVFDLLVGVGAGIFDYHLGFNIVFLVLNGGLSYGFMIATVMLLDITRVGNFYFTTVLLGAFYEVINYVYPVWSWTFGSSFFEEMFVILVAYWGLAILMKLVVRWVKSWQPIANTS